MTTFERTLGAQLRATRTFGERLAFDARFLYDDIEAPTTRFAFVAGNRERVAPRASSAARRIVACALRYERESQDRADPNVSPDRERLMSVGHDGLTGRWFTDGMLSYRTSRYDESTTPRNEQLDGADLGRAARAARRTGC